MHTAKRNDAVHYGGALPQPCQCSVCFMLSRGIPDSTSKRQCIGSARAMLSGVPGMEHVCMSCCASAELAAVFGSSSMHAWGSAGLSIFGSRGIMRA